MEQERSEKFLKDHGCTTWGNFNNPPLPYAECNISEFWGKFLSYGIKETEYRQVKLDKPYNDGVHILVYSDVIYMIKVDWNYSKEAGTIYTPKCYIVGCDHDWNVMTDIHGLGKRTCKKCGYWENYDSSD